MYTYNLHIYIMSIYIYLYLSIYLSVYLSICLSIYLSIYLYICIYISYIYTYIHTYIHTYTCTYIYTRVCVFASPFSRPLLLSPLPLSLCPSPHKPARQAASWEQHNKASQAEGGQSRTRHGTPLVLAPPPR